MAVIQMVRGGKAKTFGELAQVLFQIILSIFQRSTVKRVDVTFDRYDQEDSIKSAECQRKTTEGSYEIKIHGPNMLIPKQWRKYLQNAKNKASLTEFLSEEWSIMGSQLLKDTTKLVLGGGFQDREKSVVIEGGMHSVEYENLSCNHEEADTRIILRVKDASLTHDRIIFWSPDTDVALLAISFYHQIRKQLWFRTGIKDKTRFIPIHSMAENLGTLPCKLLLLTHALPGCDSTSSFAKKGKAKMWNIIKENPEKYKEIVTIGEFITVRQPAVGYKCRGFSHGSL